ncbi:hypothetical protein RIF29_00008 [Crotalaria pallida]|uniref:Uncharacterized protein n=1 Tax=Crotalaria pallida TaxID=3830 RepID=A0AAN9IVA0_CROPI
MAATTAARHRHSFGSIRDLTTRPRHLPHSRSLISLGGSLELCGITDVLLQFYVLIWNKIEPRMTVLRQGVHLNIKFTVYLYGFYYWITTALTSSSANLCFDSTALACGEQMYGEIKDVFLDGAKGEGEKNKEYFFESWFSLIHQLQPRATIFSDDGPDTRWVGDEDGAAGSTCCRLSSFKQWCSAKIITFLLSVENVFGGEQGRCHIVYALGTFLLGDMACYFDSVRKDNWPSVLFAMAGGVVLSLGNLPTQFVWAFVG